MDLGVYCLQNIYSIFNKWTNLSNSNKTSVIMSCGQNEHNFLIHINTNESLSSINVKPMWNSKQQPNLHSEYYPKSPSNLIIFNQYMSFSTNLNIF